MLGVAVLGNARLILLPLVVGGWLAWKRPRVVVPVLGVMLAAFALALAPWVVRNKVSVGCFAITTDGRALWKANNPDTYGVLARGGWIDDVPKLPNSGYTPQEARDHWLQTGQIWHIDECGQMTRFRNLALRFMVDHPGEKAKLAAQATVMLWQPSVRTTEGRPNQGGGLDTLRRIASPRSCSSSTRSAPSAFSRAAWFRGARRLAARLQLALRDALRRRHALPRALGLPARALRRDGAVRLWDRFKRT